MDTLLFKAADQHKFHHIVCWLLLKWKPKRKLISNNGCNRSRWRTKAVNFISDVEYMVKPSNRKQLVKKEQNYAENIESDSPNQIHNMEHMDLNKPFPNLTIRTKYIKCIWILAPYFQNNLFSESIRSVGIILASFAALGHEVMCQVYNSLT